LCHAGATLRSPVSSPLTDPLSFNLSAATTATYTLSLHDALPIYIAAANVELLRQTRGACPFFIPMHQASAGGGGWWIGMKNGHRSEEHTSELQSPDQLVCRRLLGKKRVRHRCWRWFRCMWFSMQM